MPRPKGKKTAGKVASPPAQAEFDRLPLADLCCVVSGLFFRLHPTNHSKGEPWPPLHFSRRGISRFDCAGEVGTLCMAETLAGALMEKFDDHWGPVGSIGRSVTETILRETWVSLVSLPTARLFDATGGNLSKLGTDAQLLTGKYSETQKWALRMKAHPHRIDGILYRSRHDPNRLNVAIFERDSFFPAVFAPRLTPARIDHWRRTREQGSALVLGPPVALRDHPGLVPALVELQVARVP